MSFAQTLKAALLSVDHADEKIAEFTCASVLLPLFFDDYKKQWQLILTKRAEHLKHHPGQISFPGGRYESSDITLKTTALRETDEEIGIKPEQINLIGRLPQQKTTSQFNVTPFVGVIDSFHPSQKLDIDKNEVAEVFYVSLDFVIDPNNQQRVTETFMGQEYTFYRIQYKDYNIWGATAKILVNLSRRIHSSN